VGERAVLSIVSWEVLGRHHGASSGLIDGFDLALRLSDGRVCGFGVRTGALFTLGAPARDENWSDGYRPLRCDLDPATVTRWSFDDVFWLGPEPRPCVVWSNAEGFTESGVATVARSPRMAVVLAGRNGTGLPGLAELGLGSRGS
jgi:hypothetical protein